MDFIAAVIILFIIGANAQAHNNSRIVGGRPAIEGEFPNHISLRNEKNIHICSGSIIHPRWVLSAAQCTYGRTVKNLKIVAGTNNLILGGKDYKVKKFINYPLFDPYSRINDISLIRSSINIQFTLKVNSIGISPVPTIPGIHCTLSGWGTTIHSSNQLSYSLQTIGVTTISWQQCQISLPGYPVYPTNVCTSTAGGQGVCNGDSGAPLICGGLQCGIVSWAIPCGLGYPDVHTNIYPFYPWIDNEVNKNNNDDDSDDDDDDSDDDD